MKTENFKKNNFSTKKKHYIYIDRKKKKILMSKFFFLVTCIVSILPGMYMLNDAIDAVNKIITLSNPLV